LGGEEPRLHKNRFWVAQRFQRCDKLAVRQAALAAEVFMAAQDRWLLENRVEINAKIRRGIAQLDRGEGIPEDQLDAYLANLKAKSE
jgi:hypothetical protein